MMIQLRCATAVVLAALSLAACTTPPSGNSVPASQAQTASRVSFGTITGSRPVTVEGGNAPAEVVGTIAGGVAGAALGQQIGGGTGKVVATGVGATAGAAAGQRATQAITRSQSTEWFVQLDSGATITVIQAEPAFGIGQRVQVVQSGTSTRLLPA
jgi:outer membrane lipoprotein SlyB